MPRNMSGVYSLPAGSLVTDGVDDIEASQHNTPLTDLADDANDPRPIVAGGTGATSATAARSNLGCGTMATRNEGTGSTQFRTNTQNDARFVQQTVQVIAGNGMTGGGDLSANRTLTMGSPGTLDGTTTNAVTSTSHTHALSNQLSRLDAVSGTGFVVRNGTTSFLTRSISGGGGIDVTNADGVSGNPSLSVDSTVVRTSGGQSIAGTKTFTDATRFATSTSTNIPGVGNTATGSAFNADGIASISAASGSALRVNRNSSGTIVDLRRNGDLISALTITASSTTLVDVSDQRRKTNIKPAEGDSGAVLDAIEIVEFDWLSGGHQQWGVVAQQVAEVAPDLVFVGGLPHAECTEEMLCEDDPAEKPWGWDPVGTIPMLIREVQLLRVRVAALEGE
jgi:hypothetical protein